MTIAGSDSGGGAGIQADLKTFAALEVYGTCVLTAVTAQNTQGVYKVLELPSDLVASQIDVILRDIGADSVKTGMLANSTIIETVVKKFQEYSIKNIVVDPVMQAKRGEALLQKSAIEALKEKLIPLSLVVTLNTPEVEALLGYKLAALAALEETVSLKKNPLIGLKLKQELKQAAKRIYAMGAKNVVLKGGHLPISETAMDLLYDGKNFREFKAPRIPASSIHGTHGTGCTFASAIAAWLAKGANVERAVEEAKNYITSALKSAFPVGKGCSPVHHFYKTWLIVDS